MGDSERGLYGMKVFLIQTSMRLNGFILSAWQQPAKIHQDPEEVFYDS